MKSKAYGLVLFLCLSLSLLLSLTSCGGFLDRDEAMATVNGFFGALSTDDFEAAEGYCHPLLVENILESNESFEATFRSLEARGNVDFSQGITVKKQTGFRTHTGTDGAQCEFTMELAIGEKECEASVIVFRNDRGYGITSFYIS